MNSDMTKVHGIIKAAVDRSVAKGMDEKEAFRNHVMYLATESPNVFKAYMTWLASN